MSSQTIKITSELSVEVCWCGIQHGVPKHLLVNMRQQHRDGEKQSGIYCPLGHSWVFSGPGRAAQLEDELAQANARLLAVKDQLAATQREAERQTKRTKAGVCPCCSRSFTQLARHMKTQHPDYGGA